MPVSSFFPISVLAKYYWITFVFSFPSLSSTFISRNKDVCLSVPLQYQTIYQQTCVFLFRCSIIRFHIKYQTSCKQTIYQQTCVFLFRCSIIRFHIKYQTSCKQTFRQTTSCPFTVKKGGLPLLVVFDPTYP